MRAAYKARLVAQRNEMDSRKIGEQLRMIIADHAVAITIGAIVIPKGFIAEMHKYDAATGFKGATIIIDLARDQPVIDNDHDRCQARPGIIDDFFLPRPRQQRMQPVALPRARGVELPDQGRRRQSRVPRQAAFHQPQEIERVLVGRILPQNGKTLNAGLLKKAGLKTADGGPQFFGIRRS